MRLSFLRKLPWLLALACAPALAAAPPPAGLKVAFIGDQGLGPASVAVLQLIEDEGADAVIHAGDFDYGDDPAAWDAQIDATLGSGFPYFALIGNHDDIPWYIAGGYQERIAARMLRLGIPWDGDLGVKSAIHWQGLHLVMTAPGIFELGDPIGEYEDYIRDEFAGSDSIWRISSWHKLMRDMQVGAKIDETGWGVYEASREAGAIVATAHEHSYSRTHLMSDFDDQVIASTDDPLVLAADDVATGPDEGRSFAFVSGLGGRSIRNQVRDEDWWASVYTGTQDATDGALFAVFHVGGNPRLASFYFKDVDGNVIDTFTVESTTGSLDPVDPFCGDGAVDAGEACDDGNTTSGDGCDAVCQNEAGPGFCGDGIPQAGEECDDGNTTPGDGCGPLCQHEPIPGVCGDGIVHPGEECDDGNTAPGDGCSELCLNEAGPGFCGDGILQVGEECDDGDVLAGDGCDALCQHEPIPGVCGDGIVHPGEECDDGNTAPGDGCSELCLNEAGPGFCGDGILQVGEECDDGNTLAGDGCDALCQLEASPSGCAAAPIAGCLAAAKASLTVTETKTGREKLKARLEKFGTETSPSSFGDPATGATRYDLCLYDAADSLAAALTVDRAGESCGPKQKPCFKAKGSKGWQYADTDASASGTKKLAFSSGTSGNGKISWIAGNRAKKGQQALPSGIAAALEGTASVHLQLATSGAECFEAELGDIRKDDGFTFKAR